jgi:hypothetical protein
LFCFIIVALIRTLPRFSPPNIYLQTNSRLAIPTTVLFNRLTTLRNENLTPLDIGLKTKYHNSSTDFGLLYAAYGPDVLANCVWCSTTNTDTYFMYAIPSILTPHLLHVIILGIITSTFFSGPEGARWRTYATTAGAFLAVSELVLVLRNDWKANTTRRTLTEVDFFYWRLRTYRQLSFAVVDGLLGWAIWLTSTNRWLVRPPPVAQQIQGAAMAMHVARIKVLLLSRLRNAVLHDDALLATSVNGTAKQRGDLTEIEQEREVVDAKRLALSRIDVDKVRRDAEIWTEKVWAFLRPPATTEDGRHAKVE